MKLQRSRILFGASAIMITMTCMVLVLTRKQQDDRLVIDDLAAEIELKQFTDSRKRHGAAKVHGRFLEKASSLHGLKSVHGLKEAGIRAFGSVEVAMAELRRARVLRFSEERDGTEDIEFDIVVPPHKGTIDDFMETYVYDSYNLRRWPLSAVSPGQVMVDIGACAGVWTVYMLKVLQARHGIAVEPSPIPAFHLRANLELMNISSSRVTMRQNALTPADGQGEEVRFEYNTKDDLQNGLIYTTDDVGEGSQTDKIRPCEQNEEADSIAPFVVPTTSLGRLVSEVQQRFGSRIGMLRMNCEGAEIFALDSASDATRAAVDRITLELFDDHPKKSRYMRPPLALGVKRTLEMLCTDAVWLQHRRHVSNGNSQRHTVDHSTLPESD